MAFHIFQANTLVDPSAVMDNFYHVGEGHLLPRGGTSLDATTSVYDIGTSDAKWKEIHIMDAYVNGTVYNSWNLITRYVLPSATNRIAITGLNGDSDILYHVVMRAVLTAPSTQSLWMAINQDTGGTYGYKDTIYVAGGAPTAYRDSTFSVYIGPQGGGTAPADSVTFYDAYIYAATGVERAILSNITGQADEKYIYFRMRMGTTWNDTTNTITSLIFWGVTATSFGVGTTIDIWALREG